MFGKKKVEKKIQLIDLLNDLKREEDAKERILKQLSSDRSVNPRRWSGGASDFWGQDSPVSSVFASTFMPMTSGILPDMRIVNPYAYLPSQVDLTHEQVDRLRHEWEARNLGFRPHGNIMLQEGERIDVTQMGDLEPTYIRGPMTVLINEKTDIEDDVVTRIKKAIGKKKPKSTSPKPTPPSTGGMRRKG